MLDGPRQPTAPPGDSPRRQRCTRNPEHAGRLRDWREGEEDLPARPAQ
jgi:hypothetical protein